MSFKHYEEIPITIKRGDAKPYTFLIQDADGAAIDLSDIEFTSQGRKSYDDVHTCWEVELVDGEGGNDFEAGKLVLTIPVADTEKLPESGVFDISGSNDITYVVGNFKLLKDVTR